MMRFEKIKTYDTYTLKFKSDIELESGNLGLLDDINKLKIYGQITKIAYLDNTSDLEFKFNNSRCVMVKIISKNKDCYVGDFICFSSPKEIMRETLCIDIDEKIKKIVRGFMIESYLEDGRQNEPEVFGKSITDPCLGWDNTAQLVHEIYDTLGK